MKVFSSLISDGLGVKRDVKKAAHWYTVGSLQGNAWAQTNLAVMYTDGPLKQNLKEAVRLLKLAADQDHARAQFRIAQHLLNGKGCVQNKLEAVKWLERAIKNGSVSAMTELAECCEYGWGCTVDVNKAISWYEKAAASGDVKASERLMVLVATGNSSFLDDMFEHGYVAAAA